MVQKLGYVWEILNQELTQILVLNLSFHDTLILFDSNRLPSSWMISTCKGGFAATVHLKTHHLTIPNRQSLEPSLKCANLQHPEPQYFGIDGF